jgi:hypothetical protein
MPFARGPLARLPPCAARRVQPAQRKGAMRLVVVVTWFITICFGLFLLGIWLVEYDRDGRHGGASRLPVPVLSGHALLAVAGVPVWLVYIVTGDDKLAKVAALMLGGVAILGLTMVVRWIGVYRAYRAPAAHAAHAAAATQSAFGPVTSPALPAGPPERNFPVAIVACHGVFAVATVILVLLAALGAFG